MMEEWKNVVGVPDGYERHYQVSSIGRVRSVTRKVPRRGRGTMIIKGHIRKTGPSTEGYPIVSMSDGGRHMSFKVHRLVAMAFLGDRTDEGLEVCHDNGIRDDNRIENLRWDTREGNQADRKKHGTVAPMRGESHGMAKLSRSEVIEILSKSGTNASVAAQYGVCQATIRHIRTGRTWRHLGTPVK